MSVSCQQRTHAPQQMASLFDQLIGACEEGVRDGQPERLSGAFIQNQFKSASLNDGQVARTSAFQDTINIGCSLPKVFSQIGAIRHQSTRQYLNTVLINGGNTFLRGNPGKLIAFNRAPAIPLNPTG